MTDPSKKKQTYRRLLGYAAPYKARLIIGIVFGMIFGGSIFGLLVGLHEMLGALIDPASVTPSQVTFVITLLLVCGALYGLGEYFGRYFVGWVGSRVVMDLRREAFNHIHDLPLLYFTQERSGEIISRTTNDTQMVQAAVSNVIGDLVRQPFAALFAAAYILYLDATLALYSLVLFPICLIPMSLFGRRVRKFARQGQERLAGLVSILQESVYGARVVKAFGMEDYEKDRFDEENRFVFRRTMKVIQARSAIQPIVVFISCIGLVLVLIYAVKVGMGTDDIVTFAAALIALYDPIKKLSRVHLTIEQSSASADRVFEIIDTPVSVEEKPDAIAFDEPLTNIVFDDVHFAYDENESVIDGVSLAVRAGEVVAFVGSSGAGKTTFVSLIPRFYDVTGGAIQLNGKDIRDMTFKSLRNQIGIVTQETILFNDTIANNIAYGHANADRQAVEDAARRAHAHDFIMEMPDGYDTVIGERGTRLSGGQSQRIAIARALLRNPPILILDEATSALDTESERLVQDALYELMSGRTVFAIAHRLSTIRHADRIVVLQDGKVIEQGKHDELLSKGGAYKRLYDMQFSNEE